jgi:hypothetical protein
MMQRDMALESPNREREWQFRSRNWGEEARRRGGTGVDVKGGVAEGPHPAGNNHHDNSRLWLMRLLRV